MFKTVIGAIGLTAGVLGSAVAGPGQPVVQQVRDVTAEARRFLDAYAGGDQAGVLAKLSPDVVVYGSDVAETFSGLQGVRRMMQADHKLWHGAAKIGAMDRLSSVCGRDLCVLTFNAPFSLASSPPIVVRFTMTWRDTAQGWLLVQSANSTPTVGQSAEELLAR